MPGPLPRYAGNFTGPLAGSLAGSLAGLLLALTACTSGPATDPDPAGGSRSPGPSTATGEPSRSSDPTANVVPGGTVAKPAKVTATRRLLDWKPVPGPVSSTVTSSADWTLVVDEEATEATLRSTSESGTATVSTTARERISDAFLDGKYAVVVKQDRQETRPATAVVLDLDRLDDPRTVDGSSDVPTTSGGTWALGEGHLVHATVHDGAYCAATVDLATLQSTLGWCARTAVGSTEPGSPRPATRC